MGEGEKVCSTCRQAKALIEFHLNRSAKDGRDGRCKSCKTAAGHKYHFGITASQYEMLLTDQDGQCGICHKRPRTRKLAVDHDHRTGLIRGLLCDFCNRRVLGSVRDSVSLLRNAVAYLENPPAQSLLPGLNTDLAKSTRTNRRRRAVR